MRRTSLAVISLACALAFVDPQVASASSTQWISSNGVLAFRSDRDGDADVFTVDATGANPMNVTHNDGIADGQPAWSPDGSRIAFVRKVGIRGKPDLFVMNASGGRRFRLTQTNVPERDPTWSSDGTRIAFAARISPAGPFRIFVIDADGTGKFQLTTQSNGLADRSPAWSPDGSRIAFISDRNGGFPELYTMNPDGSGQNRLTVNGFVDGSPSWSPDGTRIAFERCCKQGTSEIFTIDVATRAEANLTNSTTNMDFDPSWSPDGTLIAYVSFVIGEGNIDIWSMNADGTAPTRLTTDAGPDLAPDWQPDPICTVRGTGGPETLVGTEVNDVICGLGGDDTVTAGFGNDLVFGGPGNDLIEGQDGNDLLHGDAGNDTLDGGPGFDYLDGGNGSDTCVKGSEGAVTRLCESGLGSR